MLQLAFEEFDFEWWISKCHPENTGSKRAIEKYVIGNGGERVGILPNFALGLTEEGSADDSYISNSHEIIIWQVNRLISYKFFTENSKIFSVNYSKTNSECGKIYR